MVNVTTNIQVVPAKAANLESILDIILQVINVIEAFFRLFGIEF